MGGTVEVVLAPGKKLEHLGIKIELVGAIEMLHDRGNVYEFTNLVKELGKKDLNPPTHPPPTYASSYASHLPFTYPPTHPPTLTHAETAGVLFSDKQYSFDFAATVDKPYETYTGLNVRLRYFLR